MKFNKKTIGFLFLGIACVIWIITPFMGFFNLTNTLLAIYLPLLIALGEASFLIAIALLGKEYWLKMKIFITMKWNDIKAKFNSDYANNFCN